MVGLNRDQNGSMNFLKEERRAIKTKKKKTKFKGVALALTFLGVSSLTPAGVIEFSELLPKAYAAMNIDIATQQDLLNFVEGVANDTQGYRTANVTLTADINLDGSNKMKVNANGTVTNAPKTNNWTPINYFEGTFDGNSKTISGLYCVLQDVDDIGFFSNIGDRYGVGYVGATIKNLTLKNSFILGKNNVGAIAGRGRIKEMYNVKTENTVSVVGLGDSVGGIIGDLDVGDYGKNDEEKWVHTNIPLIGAYMNGVDVVRGNGENGTTDTRIINKAYVRGRLNVGGLFGSYGSFASYQDGDKGKLIGLINEGNVGGIAKVGGNLGYFASGTQIENCKNTGAIQGYGADISIVGYTIEVVEWYSHGSYGGAKPENDPGKGIGGIAGYAENGIYELAVSGGYVTGCTNEGAVSGDDCVGGIMGAILREGVLSNCENSGNVFGTTSNIGGIIGYCSTEGGNSVSDCNNLGEIGLNSTDESANGSCVGGIVGKGFCARSKNIRDDQGDIKTVTGNNNVGGMIGYIELSNSDYIFDGCSSEINVEGSEKNIGGLVGLLESKLTPKCSVTGKITATDKAQGIGGVVGCLGEKGELNYADNILAGVTFEVAESGQVSKLGGVLGIAKGKTNISVCGISNLAISNCKELGGLIGEVAQGEHRVVLDSKSAETIKVSGSSVVGGLFGTISGGDVTDSKLKGEVKVVSGASGDAIGGIVGCIKGGKTTIDKVYNQISIPESTATTATSAGGFIGKIDKGDVFIRNGINMNSVTDKTNAAGFIGQIDSGTAKLENNINIGAVTGTTKGGIIGLIDSSDSPTVTIENTLNNDTTSGNLVGSGSATTAIHNYQKNTSGYQCVDNGDANISGEDIVAQLAREMNFCKNSYANELNDIQSKYRPEREKRDKWLTWATCGAEDNPIPTFGVTDSLKFIVNWKAKSVAMAGQVAGFLGGVKEASEIRNLGFGVKLRNNGKDIGTEYYTAKLEQQGTSKNDKAYVYCINVTRNMDEPINYQAEILTDGDMLIVNERNNRAYQIKQGGAY